MRNLLSALFRQGSGPSRQLVAVRRLLFVIACVSLSIRCAHADEPMLYFFTSKGCAPCIQVKHVIEQLGNEGYPVTTIDVNERSDWADAFRVTRTPTLALVQDNKVLGYQPRPMRAQELRDWFAAIRFSPAANRISSNPAGTSATARVRPRQTKVSLPSARKGTSSVPASFASATMHRGTSEPANEVEKLALDSTVRLRVADRGGVSYATGTIVHTHLGESLVVTCGHVFRTSRGEGTITAEIGFGNGDIKQVPGELLDYNSNANDIALVSISNGNHKVTSVEIANKSSIVDRGDRVFSLGCDNGDDPTIRNTAIKNLARYDGALKYDIYGRPVNGRSGGGLFNAKGQLIGVCNAAAVEVDEGIYSALETIHWQVAKANLNHLFDSATPDSMKPGAAFDASPQFASTNINRKTNPNGMVPIRRRNNPLDSRASQVRNVGFEQPLSASSDKEVIITVRSKSNPGDSRTVTISNPTPKLLDYLDGMQSDQQRALQMAEYRQLR